MGVVFEPFLNISFSFANLNSCGNTDSFRIVGGGTLILKFCLGWGGWEHLPSMRGKTCIVGDIFLRGIRNLITWKTATFIQRSKVLISVSMTDCYQNFLNIKICPALYLNNHYLNNKNYISKHSASCLMIGLFCFHCRNIFAVRERIAWC